MVWRISVLGALVPLYTASAGAELPLEPFPDCSLEQIASCPVEIGPETWELVSWIPESSQDSVREAELAMGSGIGLDVAIGWHTGSWEVPIAVLDSGIRWDHPDLIQKIALNTGELPLPKDGDGVVADTYDLDGNGIVNVMDYQWDPRVDKTAGVDSADHVLDPSDLIATFSDGTDHDENGFVDDIAGWDFFEDNNNPYAQPTNRYYNHGTSVGRMAGAQGDRGGRIGTCPGCPILPLRVSDSFLTDGDRVAAALAYGADMGARVGVMAIGSMTHTEQTRAAVRHADASGMVMVGAAGDENSYHHNFPSVEDPILYVHSIGGDRRESDGNVYSFLNFRNCNNYGPRLDLVAADSDCATGAVARIGGAAGLVTSAGLKAGLDLSPAEVRAVLQASADDVWLTPEELELAGTYPSQEGWDAFYGHGRVNVGRAVEDVMAGDVPPIASLHAPGWFSWPRGPFIGVQGAVSAPRSDSLTWTLEVGRGAEPQVWTLVTEGTSEQDGILGYVHRDWFPRKSFSDLGGESVVDRMHRAHRPLVTVRLVVEDAEGRRNEARRGFWIHDDPDLLPGFPVHLGSSLEASPVTADLTGDGVFELVVVTSGGELHVLDGRAEPLEGFPVQVDPSPRQLAHQDAPAYDAGPLEAEHPEGVLAGPAVGDLTGDDRMEIVVATLGGRIYAWQDDGQLVDGFPVQIEGRSFADHGEDRVWDNGVIAAPSLGDVTGDGRLEIVVAAMDQRMYVWNGGAELLSGYPLELCHDCDLGARILASPALGDLDGNGRLDAVVGTSEVPQGDAGVLFLVDLAEARVWDGWPRTRSGLAGDEMLLPVLGEGHPASPALADLDGDGHLEIASFPMLGTSGVIGHDGSDALDTSFTSASFGGRNNAGEGAYIPLATNPAFADMDGDGVADLLLGGSSASYLTGLAGSTYQYYEHALGAWSGATGQALDGFPRQVEDVSFLLAPAVADVSGDGQPEAIYGSGGYFLYAWNADGDLAPGWPKFTGGWMLGSPAVGDLEGDGWVDVAVGTRNGWLFAWRTGGPADQDVQWTGLHHDPQNTSNFHTPLQSQLGPPEGGCCRKDQGARAASFLLLLPLAALGFRRRKRG